MFAIVGTGQWRDYLGNNIYNDYTVDATTGTVTSGTGYIPGIGFDDPDLANMPAYIGSNLIGTTRRVVDSNPGGTGVSPVIRRSVLTAFGEPVAAVDTGNTRYTYAGAVGYETPEQFFNPLTELGWLHVGERYYDPAVGRFMQRDPIGIRGGANVYVYVRSNTLMSVDPFGLDYWIDSGPWYVRCYLNITGATHSWMDDKDTVDTVGVVSLGAGVASAGGAAPSHMPVSITGV